MELVVSVLCFDIASGTRTKFEILFCDFGHTDDFGVEWTLLITWFIFRFFASIANNCGNIVIFRCHHGTDTLCLGSTNNRNDMWNALFHRNVGTLPALRWPEILRSTQNKRTSLLAISREILCVLHQHAHDSPHLQSSFCNVVRFVVFCFDFFWPFYLNIFYFNIFWIDHYSLSIDCSQSVLNKNSYANALVWTRACNLLQL